MTNEEAKETLQLVQGILGLAMMKEIMAELTEEDESKRPVQTLLNRFRESVKIACDCIDIVGDSGMEIEENNGEGGKK